MTTTVTPTARRQLIDLEERIRNGDTSVTAAQLTKARENIRIEELQAEAAARAAEAEQTENLEAEQQRVRAQEFPRHDTAVDAARSAYDAALEAARTLVAAIDDLQAVDAEIRAAASGAKILDEWERHRGRHTSFRSDWTLQTLATDAQGKARTVLVRDPERTAGHVRRFDTRWHDTPERIAAEEDALTAENKRLRQRNAEQAAQHAARQAELDRRRGEAGVGDDSPVVVGGGDGAVVTHRNLIGAANRSLAQERQRAAVTVRP